MEGKVLVTHSLWNKEHDPDGNLIRLAYEEEVVDEKTIFCVRYDKEYVFNKDSGVQVIGEMDSVFPCFYLNHLNFHYYPLKNR